MRNPSTPCDLSGVSVLSKRPIRRGRRCALFLSENLQSLVDDNSEQPTPESALGFEFLRITSGSEKAVLHCLFGSFTIVEHAACSEIKQTVAPRKLSIHYWRFFLDDRKHSVLILAVSWAPLPAEQIG